MDIREALPTPVPQQVFCRPQPVFVRHPGCDIPLFSFPALSTDTAGHYGVSRPLVLNACRVLTNHKADYSTDFLATDREGRNRILIDNAPLDVDRYYFLGSPANLEASRDYPIVKTFAAFTFPRTLPDDWARVADAWQRPSHTAEEPPHASSMSSDVKRRDARCAVTKYPDGTQCAHLIPPSEKRWFVANRMTVYAPDNAPAGVDGPANGVLLRADVRACFDAHGFVFYAAAGDRRCGFVAYVVRGGCAYLPDVLHRRRVEISADVPVEYLYARFAYAVIHLPRDNDSFESVGGLERERPKEEENKQVRMQENRGMASEGTQAADIIRGERSDQSVQSYASGEDDAERDRRWREFLFGRIPQLSGLPEVEHPPETFTGCHAETPHMLRLRSKYMKRNPQVWQTSATAGTDATREDVEGFYADLLTRRT